MLSYVLTQWEIDDFSLHSVHHVFSSYYKHMPLRRTNTNDDYDQLVSNNNEVKNDKNLMFDKRLKIILGQ